MQVLLGSLGLKTLAQYLGVPHEPDASYSTLFRLLEDQLPWLTLAQLNEVLGTNHDKLAIEHIYGPISHIYTAAGLQSPGNGLPPLEQLIEDYEAAIAVRTRQETGE